MKRKILLTVVLALILNSMIFINICQSQWLPMGAPSAGAAYSFANNGSTLFAGFMYSTSGGYGGVYRSTNNGLNWTQTTLTNKTVSALTVCNSIVFAGIDNIPTTNGGIIFSDNNGVNWVSSSINASHAYDLKSVGNTIYAGCENYPPGRGGFYISTNSGLTWAQSLNGRTIMGLDINGTNVVACSDTSVFFSTNNGTSWTTTTQIPCQNVYAVSFLNNTIFAAAYPHGIYYSTNNGINWIQTSITDKYVRCFTKYGTKIFAGTMISGGAGSGVYLSTDNGIIWNQVNTGFSTLPNFYSLFIYNNYIFAGTAYLGIWRRPLSEMVTKLSLIENIVNDYSLSQNYPNPFNPTTNIKFAMPKSSEVKIAVYDISGKELEVIVNEKLQAGTYQAEWNGSNYSSGVYFYKIMAGDFVETRKMILIK